MPPSVGASYFSEMIATLPEGKCVIQQELGYPSGYGNSSSTDGSSPAAQAAFFAAALEAAAALTPPAQQKLRGVMPFDLGEHSDSSIIDHLTFYPIAFAAPFPDGVMPFDLRGLERCDMRSLREVLPHRQSCVLGVRPPNECCCRMTP